MKSTGRITLALSLVFIGAVICAGCISTNTSGPSPEGSWTLNSNENVFIIFNADGTFSGQAPLNGFGGTYTVDGDRLSIDDEIIQTLLAGSPELMQEEREFFAALKDTARWQIDGGKLILSDAANTVLLTFTASVIGEWTDENGSTIIFNADGSLGGHAPVNSFGGSFAVHGNTLVFENVYMTEMAGDEEDMQAEAAFFSALGKTAGFVISGSLLTLADAEGTALLTFVRA